jgi:ubiquinone/menaquinone biosynthesis C-methylase UbiE
MDSSMPQKFSSAQIHEFWTAQALKYGQSPSASWSDEMVIEMEIREILRHLADGDRVLDIGCANGYSTLQLASQKAIQIRGLDYVPEMIQEANLRLCRLKSELLGAAEFDVGDIITLAEPSDTYDKVVVIRVIINLGDWGHQLQGLRQCVRVLKPGGILLLSEATLQGWERLNRFRREWGLSDIPMPTFNNYLDQDLVIAALAPDLHLIEVDNFASTYYVGTRVLKPLLIRALGANMDAADPKMEWNRWLSQLPSWGDYGTQKLFVFTKK